MKKIIFILFIFYSFLNINNGFAEESVSKTINSFYQKIENSSLSSEGKIYVLKSFNSKLSILLDNKKLGIYNRKFINDSFKINNEKIFDLTYKNFREQQGQKNIEKSIMLLLKNSLYKPQKDSFIYKIVSKNEKLITTNNDFEFVENDKIKKFNFKKGYVIKEDNINSFKNKPGFIVNKSGTNEFILVEDYSIEEKIPYSEMGKYTKGFLTQDSTFSLENGNYYNYLFSKFNYFEDTYGLYVNELSNFGKISDYILYLKNDGKYTFINDYKKVKLINSDIIYGIPGKYNFLKELSSDKYFIQDETDNYFLDLKNTTLSITKGLNNYEKIRSIYGWILGNISYTENIDLEDKKIFSGILTYENKSGVCSGYARIFLYMSSFAGINDVEVINGDVIDAQDFPYIGHAWIKIGDFYYDPTFDDPVGATKTKNFDEYKYFKLERDLFYTNRYDYESTPDELKKKDLSYRKTVVKKNLSNLVSKYEKKDYVLLRPYKFKEIYGFKFDEKITLDKFKKAKIFYDVINGSLIKNGENKFITNAYFFTINDDNIEGILEQFNYNISNYYFLKWDLGNGKFEYRMATDLKFS